MDPTKRIAKIGGHLAKPETDLRFTLNLALRGEDIEITGPVTEEYGEILTPAALHFVADLARQFEGTRVALMNNRERRQQEIKSGKLPDFLPGEIYKKKSDF